MSKGMKGIIETMKNTHPALALKAQFQSEMAHWAEFFQMTKALEEEFKAILEGNRPDSKRVLKQV